MLETEILAGKTPNIDHLELLINQTLEEIQILISQAK